MMPPAWADLIEALQIMARHADNTDRPLHCEHDELFVGADPRLFTTAELERLQELGFRALYGEYCFHSYRFGSA